MGSILYMKELPPDGGGNTLFANMYRAYETLSAPIQRLCEGLTAVHDGAQVYGGRFGQTPKEGGFPRNEHPVVRTHPVTGRKALYVNRNFTTRIAGFRKHESDALLEMLYRHSETPEFQCRFAWQPNSIAFWDNRAAMHHAMWDYFPHKRLGYRVTVKGDKPFSSRIGARGTHHGAHHLSHAHPVRFRRAETSRMRSCSFWACAGR